MHLTVWVSHMDTNVTIDELVIGSILQTPYLYRMLPDTAAQAASTCVHSLL
jgi:hypothetical protein